MKAKAQLLPEPTYERAARLWNQGLDTCAIARELQLRESVIYNGIGVIREIAAEQREAAHD